MTSDELISACKSLCAFSTAEALPLSQSKLHPPGKKMRGNEIWHPIHKKTSAFPNPCSERIQNYYLYRRAFLHDWTCLIFFIACTQSKRSGLFLISCPNYRIDYASLYTVFNRFYMTYSNGCMLNFCILTKYTSDINIANTHTHTAHTLYMILISHWQSLTLEKHWRGAG